jgi:excinuclease ABC subunit C
MDKKIRNQLRKLPKGPGVYFFLDKHRKVLYVGKAESLRKRVKSYWQKNHRDYKIRKLVGLISKIDWQKTDSGFEALILEAEMIKRYRPPFNVRLRDDKSYLYLGITWSEDFPRVFYARRPDLSNKKFRYFGPFPASYVLKEAVRILRRIFPFRTCRILPKKICLWGHLGRCLAPCEGKVSKTEYRKMIGQLMTFLKGGKKDLIKKYRKQMKVEAKRKNFEEAAILRDRIYYLENLAILLKSDVILKGETKIPLRIECFDISHISGQEATGSMVVFTEGGKDTDQYRHFSIKTVRGISDTAMLAEVLRRRLKHTEWLLPNLIIIDGGRPQLNVANKVVMGERGFSIPIMSIAKGPKRKKTDLYFAGPKILTDKRLITRIRDEAHRFAHRLHSILRRKKVIGR